MDSSLSKTIIITLIRFIQKISPPLIKAFVISVLAWNLFRLYPGDRWLVVRLGNYAAPWLFLGLIPALTIAIFHRRYWLVGATVVALLIFSGRYWHVFASVPQIANATNRDNELRVMTFNVHYSNRNDQDIVNLIQTEAPDIIAFQELTDELAKSLFPKLISTYPYFIIDTSYPSAPALISRYPLESQRKPPTAWRAQHIIVNTPSGPVTIWNVHTKPALKPSGWHLQTETLSAVAEALEETSGPIVVLGDFNTTDQTENYRLITNHLTDVHHVVGQGFGFTFPEPDVVRSMTPKLAYVLYPVKPIVRIDHIFVSNHFEPQETHVVPNGFGSDHRPVVATLRFN